MIQPKAVSKSQLEALADQRQKEIADELEAKRNCSPEEMVENAKKKMKLMLEQDATSSLSAAWPQDAPRNEDSQQQMKDMMAELMAPTRPAATKSPEELIADANLKMMELMGSTSMIERTDKLNSDKEDQALVDKMMGEKGLKVNCKMLDMLAAKTKLTGGNWVCGACGNICTAGENLCKTCHTARDINSAETAIVPAGTDSLFATAQAKMMMLMEQKMNEPRRPQVPESDETGGITCSKHGKKRTSKNLMNDGAGGMCCSPGNDCKVYRHPGELNKLEKLGLFPAPEAVQHKPIKSAAEMLAAAAQKMNDMVGYGLEPAPPESPQDVAAKAQQKMMEMMGGSGASKGKSKGNAGSVAKRDGDWSCPNCGDLVFAYRDTCKLCNSPRGAASAAAAAPAHMMSAYGGAAAVAGQTQEQLMQNMMLQYYQAMAVGDAAAMAVAWQSMQLTQAATGAAAAASSQGGYR